MGDFITVCFGVLFLGSLALWLWCYGTLLKKALGISKAKVLWLLVPIACFVFPIEWGSRARELLSGTEEKQPPRWFWPLTLVLYLFVIVLLAFLGLGPWELVGVIVAEALISFLYWGTAYVLELACSVPRVCGWLLPIPGMLIALPIYYGMQAHNQLKASAVSSFGVEGEPQAAEKLWYKRGAFWIAAIAGAIWFFVFVAEITSPDNEAATVSDFSSSDVVSVEGVVVDKLTSVPISDAKVVCLHEGENQQETKSDEEGYFLLSDVPSNGCIRVEAKGYESADFDVPKDTKDKVWKFELVKTPKATAEMIAKFFSYRAFGDIYPYLDPNTQEQYSREEYAKLLRSRLDSFFNRVATQSGTIDVKVTDLTNVSENEVKVFATLTVRDLKTGRTVGNFPFTFSLKRAEDETWRSTWPVPMSNTTP